MSQGKSNHKKNNNTSAKAAMSPAPQVIGNCCSRDILPAVFSAERQVRHSTSLQGAWIKQYVFTKQD